MDRVKKLLILQSGRFNFQHNYTLSIMGNQESKPPFDGKLYTPNEVFTYGLKIKNELNFDLINIAFLKGYTLETFTYDLIVKDQLTLSLAPAS